MEELFDIIPFDQPIILAVIGIIVVLFVLSMVKALFKVALVLSVIGGVVYLALLLFTPELPEEITEEVRDVDDVFTEEAKDIILDKEQLGDTFYIYEEAGSHYIQVPSLDAKYRMQGVIQELDQEDIEEFEEVLDSL